MTNPQTHTATDESTEASAPKKHHAGRWVAGILIVIVLIAGGLYGADRYAHAKAVDRLQSALQSSASASFEGVSAQIDGFPFLTQVASGVLEHVKITSDSATFKDDSGTVSVEDAVVDMHGVSPNAPHNVQDVAVTARVPYQLVQNYLRDQGYNATISTAENGQLQLKYEFEYFTVDATATLNATEDGRGLVLELQDLNLGHVTFNFGEVLPMRQTVIELNQMPEGFKLTEVKPGPKGIDVKMQAHDVELDSLPH